jgi:hypothetical protein
LFVEPFSRGRQVVRLWIANTDHDWFDFLAAQAGIDEVNFWQSSGTTNFGAIQPGELFLFRLNRLVAMEYSAIHQIYRYHSHGKHLG